MLTIYSWKLAKWILQPSRNHFMGFAVTPKAFLIDWVQGASWSERGKWPPRGAGMSPLVVAQAVSLPVGGQGGGAGNSRSTGAYFLTPSTIYCVLHSLRFIGLIKLSC